MFGSLGIMTFRCNDCKKIKFTRINQNFKEFKAIRSYLLFETSQGKVAFLFEFGQIFFNRINFNRDIFK